MQAEQDPGAPGSDGHSERRGGFRGGQGLVATDLCPQGHEEAGAALMSLGNHRKMVKQKSGII